MENRELQIPFMGFYESIHSATIDDQMDSWADYEANYSDNAAEYKALEISESDLFNLRFDCTDYGVAQREYLESFTRRFIGELSDEAGRDIPATFKAMESPKYYNFETDRLFCEIPLSFAESMLADLKGKKGGVKILESAIEERHKSRDGFMSFYRADLATWLKKPVADWDHNELETLFLSWLELNGICADDIDRLERDTCCECHESAYQGLDSATNWEEYESKLEALKWEKLAAIKADDPEFSIPYRCSSTPDMFKGA